MKTVYVLSRNADFFGRVVDFMTGKVLEMISLSRVWELSRRIYHIAVPDILIIDYDPFDPQSLGGNDFVSFVRDLTEDFPTKILIFVFGPEELSIPLRAIRSVRFVNRDKGPGELLWQL